MRALRLCTQRMEEMVLIDGITNVEYRFRCKWSHRVMGQIFFCCLWIWTWNSGGIGGLISGSYFGLRGTVHSGEEERGILPSRLFYYTNVYISVARFKFGFHGLTEFKNLTGLIWVMFHFLKHLKVSFTISVWDTEGVQDVCFVFMSPIQKRIHRFVTVFEHFWQESTPASFSHNLVWVKVNFSSRCDTFLFWCTPFHLYSVSRMELSLICIGNVRAKLSRIAFLKHQ